MDEVIGSSIYDHVDEQNAKILKTCYDHVLETGISDYYMVAVDAPEVGKMYLEGYVCPVKEKEEVVSFAVIMRDITCLLYTSPSPRDATLSRMPSSA